MRHRARCVLVTAFLILAPDTARAAVGIDVTTSADRSPAAATVTSPPFSTAAPNELLLAFVASDAMPGTTVSVTSVTGGGLTWALVVRTNAQNGTSEIWRALAPSVLSGASVTATLSQSVTSSITVMTFTGVDTSGVNGAGAIGAIGSGNAASGAPSASLVTTRDNSWVLGAGNDWDNPIARTAAAGQSIVHQNFSSTGDTYWVQEQNAPTPAAGTSVSIDDTAPTTDQFNLSICEVLPAQTAPASLTVAVTAPAAGSALLGSTTIAASATDTASTVTGVQFQLDGVNLGSEIVSAPYAMTWDTTTTSDGTHTLSAIAHDVAGVAATSPTVPVTVNNGAASVGMWSQPFDLGIVAVNAVMLHTGKVLMFSGSYQSSWVERVWDPATGAVALVPNPYYNLFCSGQAQLPDGRILVVGGFDSSSLGAANANIFDPVTESWSAVPNMAFRRWYPTATTLPDGRMLVTSGGQTCLTCLADLPEIFDPATGRFSTLSTARLGVPYYPFMFVLPDGTVLDAGSNEQPAATSRLNMTSGSWSTVDAIVKDGHSAAMYLPGRILKSGTAADSGTTGAASATAYVIDMAQPSPAWRQVASMAFPRAYHNTTLLPDGSVLVTGGGTALDGHDLTKAVYAAELWSPGTETWRSLASASVPRLYHSTALLLPDGRVLSAGGGNDSGAINQTQGQIFSPPYLFKGSRPAIAAAPEALSYSATFSVQTPDAASIASVSLIRPGSVTHAFDEDQRFLSLTFSATADSLTIQAPANANLAPPGYYMLFLVNTNGVPSVASFVRLQAAAQDVTPPTAPALLMADGAVGSATLTWTASADDTGVAVYNIHRSTISAFSPSAANRVAQSTSTTYVDAGVAAGTYFYVVTAQDVAGNVSDPSNEAAAIVLADTTLPVVAITSPADQASVSGSIAINAIATDDVGVAGVQFQVDGAPLGAERTSSPYSIDWNTATTSNGTHTITAVARDAAGNKSPSTVTVVVSNTAPLQPGLVAAYGFNEAVGVLTHDSSGQANTGTLASATWTTNGRFGSALSFNGANSWVSVADAPSLDLTDGMTLEAWVNPASITGWRSILYKEATTPGLAYALYSSNNNSRPAGYVHIRRDIAATGQNTLPLNTWTHLAVTYDGSSLRLYVNGVLARNTNVSALILTSDGALRIGGNAVDGEYFRGSIDEVRIYNRALSASEIQADMTMPIQ